jgi:serine/threonine-protein kinase
VAEPWDPLAGRTLAGRYRLIARLGAGGMSSVYLARHVVIDRLAAVKLLRAELCQDPQHRDRFLREARAVNRIQHENIIEITDFGETPEGQAYLVMEYLPGETLLGLLTRERATPLRALDIARQVALALGRAHQMNVIHRDLKPDNVLVVPRPDGTDLVKLVDFGIAKILDAPSLTLNNRIFGTPGYIAPEYALGGPATPRTDLYSLGVVLYELSTGCLPFDVRHQNELLLKHVTEAPIPPRRRVPELPEALEQVILKCLAKRPEERHRDAFHLLEDLSRVRDAVQLEGAPLPEAARAVDDGLHIDAPRALRGGPEPAVRGHGSGDWAPPLGLHGPRSVPPSAKIEGALGGGWIHEDESTPTDVPLPSPGLGLKAAEAWTRHVLGLRGRVRTLFWQGPPAAVNEALEAMAQRCRAMGELAEHIGRQRARTLALETKGRTFRAALGVAMDALASELSSRCRERDALQATWDALGQSRAEAQDEHHRDQLLWEQAASEELLRALARECEDLEYQRGALEAQMIRMSEALEADQGALQTETSRALLELEAHDTALREASRWFYRELTAEGAVKNR